MPFNSDIERFLLKPKEVPGPGYYTNIEKGIRYLKNSIKHNKSNHFVSVEERFPKEKEKAPGPGAYKPEVALKIIDNKKHEIIPKSSIFQNSEVVR